jgi:hypothetical protein
MDRTSPKVQAADVIFVYSSGKDGYLNVELQRSIFDKGRDKEQPWFSHVALALDSEIAFEASTGPEADDPPTWSGSLLRGGVRFTPIPDLLLGVASWRVLRSSKALTLASDALAIPQPYISGLYGSKYSIKVFKDYARDVAPLRSALADVFRIGAGWTSDPADVGHRIGEEFRQRVLRDFPEHKFTFEERTFYCSDLVRAILSVIGLMSKQDQHARVTPSTLFDLLKADPAWADVTDVDYSRERVEMWRLGSRTSVSSHYDRILMEAGEWRNRHEFDELWPVVTKQIERVNDTLDGMFHKLTRMSGGKPHSTDT